MDFMKVLYLGRVGEERGRGVCIREYYFVLEKKEILWFIILGMYFVDFYRGCKLGIEIVKYFEFLLLYRILIVKFRERYNMVVWLGGGRMGVVEVGNNLFLIFL